MDCDTALKLKRTQIRLVQTRAGGGYFYFRHSRYLPLFRRDHCCLLLLHLVGQLLTFSFQLSILLLKLPESHSLTTQPQQFILVGL